MRILVVDDDSSILELLDQILTGTGSSEVVTVASGAAALAAISDSPEPFDSVLVDIQMPELDGVALTRLIRETPGYAYVAILMLTVMHEKRYLDAAFKAGATDYVTKPFDFVDLRRRINAARETCRRKRDRQNSTIIAGEMKNIGGDPKEIQLADPASVTTNPAAIDAHEFENYLAGLARIKPGRVVATAAKIHGIEKFYQARSSEEFLGLVTDAASALKDVILPEDGLLSYRGGGIFLCIGESIHKTPPSKLETQLNARLGEARARADLKGVRLLVGKQVPLALSSDLDAIASLSEAVSEVEDRAASLSVGREIPIRLIGRRLLGAEQDRLDKLAFARLLTDTLPSVEDDAWSRKLKERAQR